MKINFILGTFLFLFITTSAYAATVKNASKEPVAVKVGDKTVELQPEETLQLNEWDFSYPANRRLIQTKRLIQVPTPLSVEYCNSDEYPDDAGYCFMDLAVEKADATYCAYLFDGNSIKECLYYVNREKKLNPDDCLGFDPGSSNRQLCVDYVNSGIPSKPGQRYEETLK